MSAIKHSALSVQHSVVPASQAELADLVRQAYNSDTAIYPVGGGTALDFGLPARRPGWALSLEKLNRVVDYPARDMTITVEAGITMQALAERLAAEGQRLPVDAPQAEQATLGGMIATNFSGPRRYGHGTLRDYVIGISAVDGRGTAFKAGGRVVKNVAGYDFCKLLTGSLGTLAVITQVTLKVKPVPETSAFVIIDIRTLEQAEHLLAALVNSQITPYAIELTTDDAFAISSRPPETVAQLAVGFEGTRLEVDWMVERLLGEWREQNVEPAEIVIDPETTAITWHRLTNFAAINDSPPLVVKLNVLPGAVCSIMKLLIELDPTCSIQAHAGNGVLVVRFGDVGPAGAAKLLIQQLRPAAQAARGQVVVWSCATPEELTRQAMWGGTRSDAAVMQAVKQQFDPKNLLNPGRFFFA